MTVSTRLRFLKVGRSLTTQDRLTGWVRLGARAVQVVESCHNKADAERRVLTTCGDYRLRSHPIEAHFGTTETLRVGALPMIGALISWLRGSRDIAPDWS